MRNKYFLITILAVLVMGAVAVFGVGNRVEAPVVEAPAGIEGDDQFACTMDAKECPDGTFVGRVAPSCEFAACPGSSEADVRPVKQFTISGDNFSFSPTAITVKQGDRVQITFKNNNGFHDFVIDEYGVATKQAQSPATEVLEFTADKLGSFEYYCSVGTHRAMGMKGTLLVE
jgi:plastocyanin